MPSTSIPRLLILGASTRAAAWSARRAGFQPVCADQFADRDLQQIAKVVPVRDYPASLPDDLSGIHADAWMLTGAMENHRDVLRQLQQHENLGCYCGPDEMAITHLRDPVWLAGRFKQLGCYPAVSLAPPTSSTLSENAERVRWLRKPLAGGGGRAISFNDSPPPDDEACYWQVFTEGTPCSALFLISAGRCELLMLSRQLIGLRDAAAPGPFAYCGSVGPWPTSPEMNDQLFEIGAALIKGLEYRGLLGVDLVWNGHRFSVIEINPRWTASCELWDLAARRSAVGEHLAACGFASPQPRILPLPRFTPATASLRGKLILYADQDVTTPDLKRCLAPRPLESSPFLADLPQTGARIPIGAPICTVFASANSAEACFQKLLRRARRVRRWFPDAENSAGICNNS